MISSIPIESKSFWPIYGTLTDSATPSQSGPGINGNEEVLHFYFIYYIIYENLLKILDSDYIL